MDERSAPLGLSRRDLLKLGGVAVAAGAAGAALDVLSPGAAKALTPKRGGIFRIRGQDATTGFDPHRTASYRTHMNLSFTHSRLVKVKAGPSVRPGTGPIEPDLADSWTQPDETTYIFKLRKGIRWHPKPPVNGRELTAEDVKYTYERFLTIKGNPLRLVLEQVEKIEALDRYTVKFTLKEPFAWFLDMLAKTTTWIVPKEAVEKYGDLKRPEACIGTGPWMLERYEPNVRLTFVRNPNYFVPGLPYADGVEVTIDADPSSRLAAWLAGRYDFAPEYGMTVRRLDLDLATGRKPGLQTAEYVRVVKRYTAMKLDRPPFNDIRVRRALALATDSMAILEASATSLGHGVHNPAVPAAFVEWSIPLDQLPPEGRRLYEPDIPEAKRLLAEAGYPNGFTVPVEATPAYGPGWMDSVQMVISQRKAAGIRSELKLKEYGAYISSTIFGKFDNMMVGIQGGWTDPDSYLYRYYVPAQRLNSSGVDDPKLTEMIRLQRRTFDVAKRREILYDIQRYLSERVYYTYGPSSTVVSAWEPYVKNFAPNIGHYYGGRLMAAWLDR